MEKIEWLTAGRRQMQKLRQLRGQTRYNKDLELPWGEIGQVERTGYKFTQSNANERRRG